MEAAVGGVFCVSGVAIGTAVSTLIVQLTRGQEAARNYCDEKRRVQKAEHNHNSNISVSENSSYSDFEDPPLRYSETSSSDERAIVHRKNKRMQGKKFCSTRGSSTMNDVMIANWEGFSMEEAKAYNMQSQVRAKDQTPQQVLHELQRGNARFFTGNARRPEADTFNRRALIVQQFPKVAVLGCSDSRVPVEIVFDQGLGDMFVIRVAGNCLETATMASLQYAVMHLEVKVVIVLGHEGCGAVKCAALPDAMLDKEPKELCDALKSVKAGLEPERLSTINDSRAHDREAVATNVRRQLEGLTRDKTIMSKVNSNEVMVLGAFYEISSGIVDFFMEVEATAEGQSKVERSKSSCLVPGGLSHGVQSRITLVPEDSTSSANI